jgi:uncharacterized protein YggE
VRGRVGFCLAALFCAFLFCLPAALAADAARGNTISLAGSAARDVEPDIAYITLGVAARNSKVEAACAENAAKMNGIVKNLTGYGIEKKDVQTANFSVYPVYAREENRGDRIIAYEAENILTICVRDLNDVGKVIDSALAAGANRLDSVRFSASNEADLRKELLGAAVRDGLEKAAIVAQSAGRRVGALLEANVGNLNTQTRAAKMYDAAANFEQSPVFAGTITITANVNLVFALE